jgi:L-ascorbate metabolism protein UlaG (beta-lactamase superfamily)
VLLEADGVRLLTDPVWGARVAFVASLDVGAHLQG